MEMFRRLLLLTMAHLLLLQIKGLSSLLLLLLMTYLLLLLTMATP
jgi:hypothetical protein